MPKADFSDLLARANGRLKAGKVGVRIEQFGDRLYLRATFPPRPDSEKREPYQQRLPLGTRANATGLSLAEAEAKTVGGQLQAGSFSWLPYVKQARAVPQTVGDWIEALHKTYIDKGGTEGTWRGDYLKILKKLPPDESLTEELLHSVVVGTVPNSKTRQRACMAIAALARVAGMDYNPSNYRGSYSPDAVEPRDLPSDELIVEWYQRLKNPAWKWVYGVMATYGLRNHEVFKLDFERLRSGNDVLTVLDATKTGFHQVWAFYPEWVTEFRLADVQLPGVELNRDNQALGHSVTEYFSDFGIPFSPYALRHCWAVRALRLGFPYELAAKQMGHSIKVHERTYQRWIKPEVHQQAYDAIRSRGDRPAAPLLKTASAES